MLKAITLLEAEIKRIKTLSKVLKARAVGLSNLYVRAKYRKEEARRLQFILDLFKQEYCEKHTNR